MAEIRYPGMAPTPNQLERIVQAIKEDRQEEGPGGSDTIPQYEIRTEDFPDGTNLSITPTLRSEINQIIYSTHWEYQKRVLDHVDAICSNERQWQTVRRVLMGIMTEQVEKTRMLVSQRIRQEMYRTTVEEISEEDKNE